LVKYESALNKILKKTNSLQINGLRREWLSKQDGKPTKSTDRWNMADSGIKQCRALQCFEKHKNALRCLKTKREERDSTATQGRLRICFLKKSWPGGFYIRTTGFSHWRRVAWKNKWAFNVIHTVKCIQIHFHIYMF